MKHKKKVDDFKNLNFTCEEFDFVDYETLKIFFGDLEEVDNIQVRKQTNIPQIDRNAVTKWQE